MSTYSHTYDPPGKMAAIAIFYSSIPRDEFFEKYHIVIPSRMCDEIKFLLRCGVDKSRIFACDLDGEAVASAHKLGVNAYWGDIRWAAKSLIKSGAPKDSISSISVDLCNTVNKGLRILSDVLAYAPRGVTIGFTYLGGRDIGHNDAKRDMAISEVVSRRASMYNKLSYMSWHKDRIGAPMSHVRFIVDRGSPIDD